MATFTGYGVGGNWPQYMYIYTVATLNSQSVATNSSNITLSVYGYYHGSNYAPDPIGDGYQYIKLNDVTAYSGYLNTNFKNTSPSNKEPLMISKTFTVYHNSDGTKTVNIKVYQDTPGITTCDYLWGNHNWTLPTIARASTITSFPNFYINNGVIATAPRNSTGFTNNFELKIGSTLIAASGDTYADSYEFTSGALEGIYGLIPSSSSATATLYVTTKNGGTVVGSTAVASSTAYVSTGYAPTFSTLTSSETVAALSGIGLSTNSYIQNISKPQFNINGATAYKSAWISAYEITFAGGAYTSNYSVGGPFNITGGYTLQARVMDSRGFWSGYQYITLNFYAGNSTIATYNDFTIGSGVSVSISRNIATLTHTVQLYVGGTHINTKYNQGTAITFTDTDVASIYDLIPSTTSAAVTLYVYSYYNGTQIGSYAALTRNAYVGSGIKPSLPALGVTTSETVAAVTALGLASNSYAQNLSKPNFAIATPTAPRGTSISTFEIVFNGGTYNTQNITLGVFNLIGNHTVTVRVRDARGVWSDSRSATLTFYAYSSPNISALNGFRTATNISTTYDVLGWFYRTSYTGTIASVNAKNQLTYKFEYKLKDADSFTAIGTPTVLALGTASINSTTNFGVTASYFDPTKSYHFKFTITDKVGNSAIQQIGISTGNVPFSFGRTGVGAGKIWEKGALDVSGDFYLNGEVNVAVKKSIPQVTDLNAITTSGWYRLGGSNPNIPPSCSYGQMLVIYGGGDTIAQLVFPYNSDLVYRRSGNPPNIGGSGSWSSWVVIGDGANADTLDGLHSSQLQFGQSDRDFTDGTLIQSDINYSSSDGEPWLLEIEGNSYGSGIPFDIKAQGYIYSNTVISHGGISNGCSLSGLVLFNYGGKLCFWFPRQGYWHGYSVFINSSHAGVKKNRLVSISDSGKPAGITKEVAISLAQSWHTGNDGSGSGLDADTLDGYHASSLVRLGETATNTILSSGGFNQGSWNSPINGAITQIVDDSGAQHSVITGRTSGGSRRYGLDFLDSASPIMRIYSGSGQLQITPANLTYNDYQVLYVTASGGNQANGYEILSNGTRHVWKTITSTYTGTMNSGSVPELMRSNWISLGNWALGFNSLNRVQISFTFTGTEWGWLGAYHYYNTSSAGEFQFYKIATSNSGYQVSVDAWGT